MRHAIDTIIHQNSLIRQAMDGYGLQGAMDRRLYEDMRHMQYKIGATIVADIMNSGGRGIVNLDFTRQDERGMDAIRFILRANVKATQRMEEYYTQRIAVPHFVYFPADWVCVHCGQIVDGKANPRQCPGCASFRKESQC